MASHTAVTLLDGRIRFLAVGAETGGRLLLTEQIFPAGGGPPLHTHPMAEVFHVLEGVVEVLVRHPGAESVSVERLEAGHTTCVPLGAVHTFRPVGAPINRLIAAFTPAGTGEDFFRDAGTPYDGPFELPAHPVVDEAAVRRVLQAMARHDFVVEG